MPRLAAALCLLLLAGDGSAMAATKPDKTAFAKSVCAAVDRAAGSNALDRNFFARLLWKESLFDPNAVSPKGAQGIAQFMPETAEKRKLVDPFEPLGAVAASAAFLAELKKEFGNLGLAAAAYNAGEKRIHDWLDGKRGLPEETQDYVAFITGRVAEEWRDGTAAHAIPSLAGKGDFSQQCFSLASRQVTLRGSGVRIGKKQPWGVLLTASFNEGQALSMFKRLKLRYPQLLKDATPMVSRQRNLSRGSKKMAYVMVGAKTQADAQKLCSSYGEQGLPCVVRKNR